MIKLGIIKLGARITFGDTMGTSGGSGEAASIIEMLSKSGDFDIRCFTKRLKKDSPSPHKNVFVHDIKDDFGLIKYCDKLIIINGSVNFFGGAEDEHQILNYKAINNFPNDVTYIYCDPNLPLRQIWPSMAKKEWASKYNEEDIVIKDKRINIITQLHNTNKAIDQFTKQDIYVASCNHYPLYKFPMMREQVPFDYSKKEVDISYGGTFRAGRRAKKLHSFFFDYPEDIKVELFGKIKEKDFKNLGDERRPIFSGAVKYSEMINKMSKAKAHIVIGDAKYPDFGMISQRVYESIMANCVTFVDADFDRDKVVYGNTSLGGLLYVNSKEDVIKKMHKMTKDDIQTICALQHSVINFNTDKYVEDFAQMIKEIK